MKNSSTLRLDQRIISSSPMVKLSYKIIYLCLFSLSFNTQAITVRVASFNVLHGIGQDTEIGYKAAHFVLKRIDADVVVFQELSKASIEEWEALAEKLGYFHTVIGERGPFAGSHYIGYWSRFEILSSHSVQSPDEAKELSRIPVRVVLDVPRAEKPLVVWGVHQKSGFDDAGAFRRAIEAKRIITDINNYVKENPSHDEFIILGDFNDDYTDDQQVKDFKHVPRGLPKSFVYADDIKLPLPYKRFPVDHFVHAGGGMIYVKALQTGLGKPSTYLKKSSILDYVFVSQAIAGSLMGAPRAEIYNSEGDGENVGLSKWPMKKILPTASKLASDHMPILIDVHMADAR